MIRLNHYRKDNTMNQVLSLQAMTAQDDIELKAGSSLSVNCKVISTVSVAIC